MPDTKDPVVFILGEGGEEVSNDPRWFADQQKKQFESASKATGGQFDAQLREQIRAEVLAEIQANFLENNENRGTATLPDTEVAEMLGTGQPRGTFDGRDVPQNAVPVRIVNDQAPASDTDEDDSDNDLEKPVDKMTGDELKAEVESLRSQGVEVDTSGVKKVGELRERVQAARDSR